MDNVSCCFLNIPASYLCTKVKVLTVCCRWEHLIFFNKSSRFGGDGRRCGGGVVIGCDPRGHIVWVVVQRCIAHMRENLKTIISSNFGTLAKYSFLVSRQRIPVVVCNITCTADAYINARAVQVCSTLCIIWPVTCTLLIQLPVCHHLLHKLPLPPRQDFCCHVTRHWQRAQSADLWPERTPWVGIRVLEGASAW